MMTTYAMLINTKRCIGCYTCRSACQIRNNLAPKLDFIRYTEREYGDSPDIATEVIPHQCNHCEDAPCVHVCPTGASYINDSGNVQVNEDRCIGCRYCMEACPYQARVYNEDTGTVDKCRFCAIAAIKNPGNPIRSCVEACLTEARMFGDIDDPNSAISKAILKYNAQPLAGDLTRAKIFYVR